MAPELAPKFFRQMAVVFDRSVIVKFVKASVLAGRFGAGSRIGPRAVPYVATTGSPSGLPIKLQSAFGRVVIIEHLRFSQARKPQSGFGDTSNRSSPGPKPKAFGNPATTLRDGRAACRSTLLAKQDTASRQPSFTGLQRDSSVYLATSMHGRRKRPNTRILNPHSMPYQ